MTYPITPRSHACTPSSSAAENEASTSQPENPSSSRSSEDSFSLLPNRSSEVFDTSVRPRQNMKFMHLELPSELAVMALHFSPKNDVINFRLINHQSAHLGAMAIKKLKVSNGLELQKAVKVFRNDGIESMTLEGRFFDENLKNLPASLKQLIVSNCFRLTQLPALRAPLEYLDVSKCINLKSDLLETLPASLIHLNLAHCKQLNFDSLERLPAALQYLNFSHCDGLTDNTMNRLIPRLPLNHLDLSWCANLSDAAFQNLPTSIDHLVVPGCFKLTDAVLKKYPPSLKHLDVSFNALTDNTFHRFVDFTHLRYLDVSGCVKLTDAAFQHLPTAQPPAATQIPPVMATSNSPT